MTIHLSAYTAYRPFDYQRAPDIPTPAARAGVATRDYQAHRARSTIANAVENRSVSEFSHLRIYRVEEEDSRAVDDRHGARDPRVELTSAR